MSFQERLHNALTQARTELLSERQPSGYWHGKLSSSALSTATAVTALAIVNRESGRPSTRLTDMIVHGLNWLAANVNADGGWGDTTLSHSNLSTTTLGWAAFGVVPEIGGRFKPIVAGAEQWLNQYAGGIETSVLVPAILRSYGQDRTFSVPILTMCALAGRLGSGPSAWKSIVSLPFELAACPPRWFAALRLPVVSYALPALIAIGQARHHHLPTRNPALRWMRDRLQSKTLQVLDRIQPRNGGFLEATPLTSFVVMSLAGSGYHHHPVTRRGLEFLTASMRSDGGWPIDTNLATWLTTLSVNAIVGDSQLPLPAEDRRRICDWLLAQQFQEIHPYTQAAPGGWAWTDLPGGVPDADDTAGALLALRHLGEDQNAVIPPVCSAINWLCNLQNRDGGMPTFCRGWGKLPFDRSSPDLTAHAVRAMLAWREALPAPVAVRVEPFVRRSLGFLKRSQQPEGAWYPLWFGNQYENQLRNLTYGTARVLLALQVLRSTEWAAMAEPILIRGANWLLSAQNADGSWGGFPASPPSVEETGLAVEALASILGAEQDFAQTGAKRERLPGSAITVAELAPFQLRQSVRIGTEWLIERIETGTWRRPAPIGFYFAKLWYYETLYPLIFTAGALGRVARVIPSLNY